MEQYKDEVEVRWGKKAYADGETWWKNKTPGEQQKWKDASDSLSANWQSIAQHNTDPQSEEAQALAAEHVAWLESIPGTPGYDVGQAPDDYILGLAQMYIEDDRFAANYGGVSGATFVRESLKAFVAKRNAPAAD